MSTTSARVPVSSHVACARGSNVSTGVTMPIFMVAYACGSPLVAHAERRLRLLRVSLLPGHDRAVGDDVLLHLGRAGADRRVALEAVEPGPRPAVDRVGTAAREQARRSEQIDRQL